MKEEKTSRLSKNVEDGDRNGVGSPSWRDLSHLKSCYPFLQRKTLLASNPSLRPVFGDQEKRECDQHKNRHLPLAVTHREPGQITSFSKCITPLLFGQLLPNRLRNLLRQIRFPLHRVGEEVGLSWGPGVYQLERGHRALCTCASVSSPVETVLGQTGYGGEGVEGECPRKEAVEVFQKTEMYARDRTVRLTGGAQNILQNRHMYLTLTL